MANFIIMTTVQAAGVRGPTSPDSALDPRALLDGTFGLPVAVLTDPVHAIRHDVLATFPVRALTAADFPQDPAS